MYWSFRKHLALKKCHRWQNESLEDGYNIFLVANREYGLSLVEAFQHYIAVFEHFPTLQSTVSDGWPKCEGMKPSVIVIYSSSCHKIICKFQIGCFCEKFHVPVTRENSEQVLQE